MSIDQDLKGLLCEAPGRCVPYAVVEGDGGVRRRCSDADAPLTPVWLLQVW